MKRQIRFLISVFILVASVLLVACRGQSAEPPDEVFCFAEFGLDENRRFTETRSITALVWERFPDRMPDFTQGHWAEWVRQTILEEHNIDVTIVSVSRWNEEGDISRLLRAGRAPDVSFTFYANIVDTFSEQGALTDLLPLLDRYRNALPNLYNLLTPTNIYWELRDNQLYSMQSSSFNSTHRMNTFVREDWLETLGLQPPTNINEFETMLIAFRDNATLLLGDNAHMMIPYHLTSYVGWSGYPVITSFIPNDITDRQWYIYGFDDRRFMMPNIKEGVRVLNSWFNQGLLWDDFALHSSDDPIFDELIRLGYVGSFSGDWDMPFRVPNPNNTQNRDITVHNGLIMEMRQNVSPEANFIVVHPFQNDAGIVRMQVLSPSPQAGNRQIFIPQTSTKPLAALLYLDFMSRLDVLTYLQFGYHGIHHYRHPDGSIEILRECPRTIWDERTRQSIPNPAREVIWPDHLIVPSLHNFDFTPTVNGIDIGDTMRTATTFAFQFPGITPEEVAAALATGHRYSWHGRVTDLGRIYAEAGMRPPLATIREDVLNQAIVVSVADFDHVFDRGMSMYMSAGGSAIIRVFSLT